MSSIRRVVLSLGCAVSMAVVAVGAHADLIRITPVGVTPSEQDATGNTHPVPISPDGFRTTFHGGGSKEILDPLIIILATPTPSTAPSLVFDASDPTFDSVSITLGGTNVYGGSWNTATGFAGTYDQNTSKDSTGGQITVYEYIGFTPDGVNSENYPNWTGATGLTSWNLWVYQIAFNPDFGKGDWIEFATTGLNDGSYVVGYGCTGLNFIQTNCKNEGATQSTPFTFAGLVRVSEPGSVALLGLGLLGLGLLRRKRAA